MLDMKYLNEQVSLRLYFDMCFLWLIGYCGVPPRKIRICVAGGNASQTSVHFRYTKCASGLQKTCTITFSRFQIYEYSFQVFFRNDSGICGKSLKLGYLGHWTWPLLGIFWLIFLLFQDKFLYGIFWLFLYIGTSNIARCWSWQAKSYGRPI